MAAFREREERIRTFNRAVSHEIKNRIGTIVGASDILHELPDMPAEERTRFLEIVRRNARLMQSAVANILAVGRSGMDARHQRHISLRAAAQEAIRQVREAAHEAGVDLQIAPDIVEVDVNAAAVELCLTNYLSNAIKYVDRSRHDRVAVITARREPGPRGLAEIVVRVRDNGLGVPLEKRDRLFERFYRAHETISEVEGTGLGLSIVRDTAGSQGGRAWAEFPEGGSEFSFSLPDHRTGVDKRGGEAPLGDTPLPMDAAT